MIQWTEGQVTDCFSYIFLEITKKHVLNHKITNKSLAKSTKKCKSQRNYKKSHKKSLKNITKILNYRRKSCDLKISKVTYAFLRSDLRLAMDLAIRLLAGEQCMAFPDNVETGDL